MKKGKFLDLNLNTSRGIVVLTCEQHEQAGFALVEKINQMLLSCFHEIQRRTADDKTVIE
jgi:hypothetical protein